MSKGKNRKDRYLPHESLNENNTIPNTKIPNTRKPYQNEEERFKNEENHVEEKQEINIKIPNTQKDGTLNEIIEFENESGQKYRISPFLSKEDADLIEKETGIILKPNDKRTITNFLGRGSYGIVYVGENLSSQSRQFVATKLIFDKFEQTIEEAKIQEKLTQTYDSKKSHLMPLYDVITIFSSITGKIERVIYVMPLAALGNLTELKFSELRSKDRESGGRLGRLLGVHIAKGLLLGLWQIHSQKIYHLDLKLENVFVTQDGKIKLGDFGCAEEVSGHPPMLTLHYENGRLAGNGDRLYFSPERVRANVKPVKPFDCSKADVYAAGAALYELLYGDFDPERHMKNLKSPDPKSMEHLIKHLLDPSPSTRWTLEQALNHAIFEDPSVHDAESMEIVLDFLRRFIHQLQRRTYQVEELIPVVSDMRRSHTELVSHLETMFQSWCDTDALALYVPLEGSLRPGGNVFDLKTKVMSELESEISVQVIFADGGSGKSIFCQHLTLDLFNSVTTTSDATKPWLPLYIPLSSVTHSHSLLDALRLSGTDIRLLSQRYRLVIIGDGYEEQANWTNLYVQNHLHQHDIRLVLTCRPSSFNTSEYKSYFLPYIPGEATRGYQELFIAPFSPDHISQYCHKYLTAVKNASEDNLHFGTLKILTDDKWQQEETYQQTFQTILGLKELAQNPFLLRLIMEVLPFLKTTKDTSQDIVRWHTSSKIQSIDIYETFINMFQEKQLTKNSEHPFTLDQLWTFAQNLAYQMSQKSVTSVTFQPVYRFDTTTSSYQPKPDYWAHATGLDSINQFESLFHYIPIQATTSSSSSSFGFIHLTIMEYLTCRKWYHECLTDSVDFHTCSLNQFPLTQTKKEHAKLQFLGEWASRDTTFFGVLLQAIQASRDHPELSVVAANCVSILNAAKINLSELDFHGVHIPYADLSGALLQNTNLSHANLTCVNFQNAWLVGANLTHANLQDVKFGRSPSIFFKNRRVFSFLISAKNEMFAFVHDATNETLGIVDITPPRPSILDPFCTIRFSHPSYNSSKFFHYFVNTNLIITLSEHAHSIEIRDARTANLKRTISLPKDQEIVCMAFDSWDEKHFALATRRGRIMSYHVDKRDPVMNTSFGERYFEEMVYDKKGQMLLLVTSKEFFLLDSQFNLLWNCDELDGLGSQLTLSTGCIQKVEFSAKSKLILHSFDDITVWSVAHHKKVQTFHKSGKDPCQCLLTSSNEKFLFAAYGKTIMIGDLQNGEWISQLEGHSDSVTNMSFTINQKFLVSSSLDGSICQWDAEIWKNVPHKRPDLSVSSVAFHPNGTILALSSGNTIQLYVLTNHPSETQPSLQHLETFKEDKWYIEHLTFTPDGKYLAFACKFSSTVGFFHVEEYLTTGQHVTRHFFADCHIEKEPRAVHVPPFVELEHTEKRTTHRMLGYDDMITIRTDTPPFVRDELVSACAQYLIKKYNNPVIHPGYDVRNLLTTSTHILAYNSCDSFHVWDHGWDLTHPEKTSVRFVCTSELSTNYVRGPPPDATRKFSYGFVGSPQASHADRTIFRGHSELLRITHVGNLPQLHLYTLASLNLLEEITLTCAYGDILHAVFDKPGQHLTFANHDTLIMYSIETKKPVNLFMEHADKKISALTFSPDQTSLVSAGLDRSLVLYTSPTKALDKFVVAFRIRRLSFSVTQITWNSNSSFATCSDDGTLRYWRVLNDPPRIILSWSSDHQLHISSLQITSTGLSPDDTTVLQQEGATVDGVTMLQDIPYPTYIPQKEKKDYGEASETYGCLLALRGKAKYQFNYHLQAIHDFDRALEVYPTTYSAITQRAELKIFLGKYHEALQELNQPVKWEKTCSNSKLYALCLRGDLKRYCGLYKQALQDYDAVLKEDSKYPYTLTRRSMVHAILGNPQALADHDKQMSLLNPRDQTHPILMGRLSVIQAMRKNYTMVATLEKLEVEPHNEPLKSYFLGWTAMLMSKYQEAVKYFDESMNDDDYYTISSSLANRGLCYFHLGELSLARDDLGEALKRIPNHGEWKNWFQKCFPLARTNLVNDNVELPK